MTWKVYLLLIYCEKMGMFGNPDFNFKIMSDWILLPTKPLCPRLSVLQYTLSDHALIFNNRLLKQFLNCVKLLLFLNCGSFCNFLNDITLFAIVWFSARKHIVNAGGFQIDQGSVLLFIPTCTYTFQNVSKLSIFGRFWD